MSDGDAARWETKIIVSVLDLFGVSNCGFYLTILMKDGLSDIVLQYV